MRGTWDEGSEVAAMPLLRALLLALLCSCASGLEQATARRLLLVRSLLQCALRIAADARCARRAS